MTFFGAEFPEVKIENGNLNTDDIIEWLNSNSIQWRKANSEAHVHDLNEHEKLLLCISYYAQQHQHDLKQLMECMQKLGVQL